jgi:hypothetical protein
LRISGTCAIGNRGSRFGVKGSLLLDGLVLGGLARRWFLMLRRGYGFLYVFIRIFYDVLHDQSNAAVGRVKRIVFLAQTLIGESANL